MFHGSMVALVTPMNADLSIDEESLRALVDWHISNGTSALIVMGTTGESATATAAEKQRVIECVIDEARERIPVIAGTASVSVPVTIAQTQAAMAAGADACLLLSPPYVKPTQEGLFQYFREIARNVPIPQLIYNVPSRTASDVLPETIIRLADIANIVGVKEATGEIDRVRQILDQCGDKLDVYSGDDHTCLDLMQAGGKGVISVTANVAPKQMSLMAKAALSHDLATAQAMQNTLMPLHKVLFVESNPIPVKWALQDMGKIGPGIRPPLTPLSGPAQAQVRAAIKQAQIMA